MRQRQGQKPAGLYIESVDSRSAQNAGLKTKQRITKVDGKAVMADDLGKLQAEQALRGRRHSEVKVEVVFWNYEAKKEETDVKTCRRTVEQREVAQ